jgi:hypothetical protein
MMTSPTRGGQGNFCCWLSRPKGKSGCSKDITLTPLSISQK